MFFCIFLQIIYTAVSRSQNDKNKIVVSSVIESKKKFIFEIISTYKDLPIMNSKLIKSSKTLHYYIEILYKVISKNFSLNETRQKLLEELNKEKNSVDDIIEKITNHQSYGLQQSFFIIFEIYNFLVQSVQDDFFLQNFHNKSSIAKMYSKFPIFIQKIESNFNKNILNLGSSYDSKSVDPKNCLKYLNNKFIFKLFYQNEIGNVYNFTKKNIELMFLVFNGNVEKYFLFINELSKVENDEIKNDFLHEIIPEFFKNDISVYLDFQKFAVEVGMQVICDSLIKVYIEKNCKV